MVRSQYELQAEDRRGEAVSMLHRRIADEEIGILHLETNWYRYDVEKKHGKGKVTTKNYPLPDER